MTHALILATARDSLTAQTWSKGGMFYGKLENSSACMCAHGAVQAVVNPDIASIFKQHGGTHLGAELAFTSLIRSNEIRGSTHGVRCTPTYASVIAERNRSSHRTNKHAWDARVNWVRLDLPAYGNLDTHYLLGMVGLTPGFNDTTSTKLSDIHSKFNAAIELATSLGV